MNAIEIIRKLEATNSRLEKEQIIAEAWATGEREFFMAAQMVHDPLISFGVATVAEILDEDDGTGHLSFNDFLSLARRLQKRELTGHAARDAIHEAAQTASVDQWNVLYRRILLKDLRIGADKTINKILGRIAANTDPEAEKFLIRTFSPQLARDGADEKNHKHLVGEKYIDLKLDGVRLATVIDIESGEVTQYTRDGAINNNFPHIRERLKQIIPMLPGSVVLDGEVVAASFSELMEQLNRKKPSTSEMKLAAFDLIPLADFRRGHSPMPQKERHEVMVALLTAPQVLEAVGPYVYPLPKTLVNLDTPEGRETLRAMRTQAETDKAGDKPTHEGVMVKDVMAPYQNGWNPETQKFEDRPIYWLKLKPTISVTLMVKGLENGKAGKKFEHMVGGLVCEGTSDCGKDIEVVVGGGLKEWMRKEWMANPDQIVGWYVEIEADGFSKAKNSDKWSLRFPRLIERRGTKPGEKI